MLINSQPIKSGHVAFGIDNYGGARTTMAHLLASGHSRIAFIAGPPDNYDAFERLAKPHTSRLSWM